MNYNKVEQILNENHCDLITLKSTSTTMDEAKKNINQIKSNFVIIADQQTAGRGRRGNNWISPPGNIYLSIVLKNFLPINQHYLFSVITLLSIKKTINNFGRDNIYFKWPNDIFFQKKKFGGVLLENINQDSENQFMIIGIGINLLSSPKVKNYDTTFIKQFVNIENNLIFLEYFFINFFNYFKNYDNEKKQLLLEFKKSLMFLNEKISIQIDNDKNVTGIFKDINQEGGLILDNGDEITHIYSGNILI